MVGNSSKDVAGIPAVPGSVGIARLSKASGSTDERCFLWNGDEHQFRLRTLGAEPNSVSRSSWLNNGHVGIRHRCAGAVLGQREHGDAVVSKRCWCVDFTGEVVNDEVDSRPSAVWTAVEQQSVRRSHRVDERSPRVRSIGANQYSCARGDRSEHELLGEVQLACDVNGREIRAVDSHGDTVTRGIGADKVSAAGRGNS